MNTTTGTGLTTPPLSYVTYQPTMKATITIQNKTSLSEEEFNAKIQKLITKLQAKFNVKDYYVTF